MTAVIGLLAASAACAQSAHVCDSLPRSSGNSDSHLLTAPDGAVWYTDPSGNRLVRVAPDRSVVPHVPVDADAVRLSGLALGPDGALWYTKDKANRVGRMPLAGGTGTEFALPPQHGFPADIAAGPDGALWFHDPVKQQVGRITTAGAVTMLDAPAFGGRPFNSSGLTIGPDGGVWVSVIGHNAIYRVDPATSRFKRFDIASPDAQPRHIVAGRDGNLWFTMPAVNKLGRLTTDGAMTEFDLGDSPTRVLAGADDKTMWVSFSGRSLIGRFDIPSGRIEKFACGSNPGTMTIGPDGRPWALGNMSLLFVRARSDAAAAVVAATGSVPAPPKPGAAPARRIEVVAATALEERLNALEKTGRVLVQFSSNDRSCGYCVSGNAGYEALAARYGDDRRVIFLRVMFDPWKSVGDSVLAGRIGLSGLPAVLAFEGGKAIDRHMGTARADELDTKLLGDLRRR